MEKTTPGFVPLVLRTLSDVEALHHEVDCECQKCETLFGKGDTVEKITMHAGESFLVYDEAGVKREVTSEEFVSKEAGDEVDRRARKYQADHPGVEYARAVEIVLDLDEPLKKNYARR